MAIVPQNMMVHNYLSQLEVRAEFLERRVATAGKVPPDLTAIKDAIQGIRNDCVKGTAESEDLVWSRIYQAERRLALLEPDETLVAELRRRLDDAMEQKVKSAPRLQAYFDAALPLVTDTSQTPPVLKAGGSIRLRALLLAVLEDTHWTLQRKFYARPIQKKASRLVAGLGIMGCVLFLLPYFFIYKEGSGSGGTMIYGAWAWLPLYTAASTGFFGAMFSRLLTLQGSRAAMTLGELNDARSFWSNVLRGAVGTTGAIIVYFFLLSGVVGGALIPKFNELGFDQFAHRTAGSTTATTPLNLVLPNAQLALLVVWSFLAGFSERLVPSVLKSSEATIREPPKPAT